MLVCGTWRFRDGQLKKIRLSSMMRSINSCQEYRSILQVRGFSYVLASVDAPELQLFFVVSPEIVSFGKANGRSNE